MDVVVFLTILPDDIQQLIIGIENPVSQHSRNVPVGLDILRKLVKVVTCIPEHAFTDVQPAIVHRGKESVNNRKCIRVVDLLRVNELSLVQDAQVAELALLPFFGNREEIVAVRSERITERRLIRIHYEIVAVRISDLVAQRLQIIDGNRFSTIKRRQVDDKSVGRKVTAEPLFEQCEEFQHLFPCTTDDKMDVIVHQHKGDDPDTRAIIGTHCHEGHRIDEVFPVIENDGLLFARRTQMPHASIFFQCPFENPPAPLLLLEIRMFLSHNLFHINLQRHRGYG